jgi:hypothetical protein
MNVREFELLREKIQALIRSNISLQQERKSFAERLLSRERQVRELKDRCERYERSRKEAYHKISSILAKIETLK